MKTLSELKQTIKDAIWELKNSGVVISVDSVYAQANRDELGTIAPTERPLVLEYLESIKHNFLFTSINGQLELTPFGKGTINDLISRA